MKWTAWMLLLVGGSLATSIAALSRGEERGSAPSIERDRPQGECCLWRLGLVTNGKMEYKLDKPHMCPTGETAQGSGFLELKPLKSTGRPCDDDHKLIPAESQLNAAIHPIRRKDDLAHISGTFTISSGGKGIFEGDIELFHRVNTHYQPFGSDPCDRKDHMQGWLTGKGVADGPANGYLIRAMLVARTDPLDGGMKGYALGETHMNGLIIKCKQ